MSETVCEEQLCAAPGRSIHDGNVLVQDIVSYVRSKGLDGYLLSLDRRKAFDMVDREFLFKFLRKLGVDKKVLGAVKALYGFTRTQIQVNGHLLLWREECGRDVLCRRPCTCCISRHSSIRSGKKMNSKVLASLQDRSASSLRTQMTC